MSKVSLLPTTLELLEVLEKLSTEDRRVVCEEAGVPYNSLSAWRTGKWHPGLDAVTRLLTALDKHLVIVDGRAS